MTGAGGPRAGFRLHTTGRKAVRAVLARDASLVRDGGDFSVERRATGTVANNDAAHVSHPLEHQLINANAVDG